MKRKIFTTIPLLLILLYINLYTNSSFAGTYAAELPGTIVIETTQLLDGKTIKKTKSFPANDVISAEYYLKQLGVKVDLSNLEQDKIIELFINTQLNSEPTTTTNFEETAVLGVYTHAIPQDILPETKNGAYVSSSIAGTGAEAAGIQSGDVITALNGISIGCYNELVDLVHSHRPGERVTVNYLRNGVENSCVATLGKARVQRESTNRPGEKIDLAIVVKMEKQAAHQYKLKNNNNLEVSSMALSPNPSQGEFAISFHLDGKGDTKVTVMDITGREIYSEIMKSFTGDFYTNINIAEYPKGSYFVQITQNDKVLTKKILIQ